MASRGRPGKVRIRDIDRGYAALLKRLGVRPKKGHRGNSKGAVKRLAARAAGHSAKPRAANTLRVTVGIHEEEGSEPEGDSGATVAEVAAIQELGLAGEQRSFVRAYFDQNEARAAGEIRTIGRALVTGKLSSLKQGAESFGAKAASGMREFIESGNLPADQPETVEHKGSSTPLIETGNLVSKITSKVSK